MFNRIEIMKAAWNHYRKAIAYVASNPYLAGTVVRFADCLKEEWKRAKAVVEAGKVAAAAVRREASIAGKIEALRNAIQELDYKSFRYSIASARRALDTELAVLTGEAA